MPVQHRKLLFQSQLNSRIFGIAFGELPQQILRVFVNDLRQDEFHFDVFVAVRIAAQAGRALPFQAKDLSRLCPRRDAKLGLAADSRHFNLCAQRSFGQRHGNRAMNVIAFARKNFVRRNIGDNEQIAWRRA